MERMKVFLITGALLLLVCGCGRDDEEIWNTESISDIKNETMSQEETTVSEDEVQQEESIIVSVKENITVTEALAAELEKAIQTDATLTQSELNEKSYELYMHWDSSLNSVWNVLKQVLDEETMQALTKEELEWIAWKEEAIAEAGAHYQGGSIQALVMNMKAAELTKERVYELLQLLD